MLTTSYGGWGTSSTCVSSIIHKYNYHKQSRLSLHLSFMKSHLANWHLRIFLAFFRSTMYAWVNVCVWFVTTVEGCCFFCFTAYFCFFLCSSQLWNQTISQNEVGYCYHWLSDIKTLFYDHLCLSYPHNKYDDIEMGEDLPVILSPWRSWSQCEGYFIFNNMLQVLSIEFPWNIILK